MRSLFLLRAFWRIYSQQYRIFLPDKIIADCNEIVKPWRETAEARQGSEHHCSLRSKSASGLARAARCEDFPHLWARQRLSRA
jgi:hypothetical protein